MSSSKQAGRAIILSIGDELTLGQTIDTNSAWISQQLAAVGCAVVAHVTVADDQTAIERAIAESCRNCDWLIISGGIGPTEDDLTRQALAAVLAEPLELNEEWLQRMQDFFTARGRPMPESNRIQAMIPRGAKPLLNGAGTALGIAAVIEGSGFRVQGSGNAGASAIGDQSAPFWLNPEPRTLNPHSCRVFVLPGVPKEMKLMFQREVLPPIREAGGGAAILSRTLHTFGLGESAVAEKLGDLMKRGRNPSVGTTVSGGVVSLRVNARFSNVAETATQLESTAGLCRAALGPLIYGEDEQTLQSVVAELLKRSSPPWTVATAESCTGGLLAKMLTDIPGSSAYFTHGWVTYANAAKTELLGVGEALIGQYGAVSEAVASAMATGARARARSDFALAISGIAGPDGGTPAKPVGTTCIALADESGVTARTFPLFGDREMIRDRGAKMALTLLRFRLLNIQPPF
jgi:nicotinamide-nucleotide amidase